MILLLLLACGGSEGPTDGSASGPAPAYTDGVYTCCAEGDDTDCCDGFEQGMCFRYGGVYGECIPDGGELEAKIICALCCSGEHARDPMVETTERFDGYPEGCGPGPTPPSVLVCVSCGDGACGEGENRCVCPEDCG